MFPRPTPRAYAVVVAALALVALGRFLGRPEVVGLGAFLFTLPVASWLLGWWWVRAGRDERAVVARRLSEDPAIGTPIGVDVEVSGAPMARGRESLTDLCPGPSPRREGERWHYDVSFEHRGSYRLGPFLSTRRDRLGLVSRTAALDAGTVILVPDPVPEAGTIGSVDGLIAAHTHRGADPDTLTRPYREGDPYRRIHWPVSARQGRVMVRPDAEEPDARPSVVVDRHRAHYAGTPTLVHVAGRGDCASVCGYDAALRTTAAVLRALRAAGQETELLAFPAWDTDSEQEHLSASLPSAAPEDEARPQMPGGAGSLVIVTGLPGPAAAAWPGARGRQRVTVILHGSPDARLDPEVAEAWDRAGWTWFLVKGAGT